MLAGLRSPAGSGPPYELTTGGEAAVATGLRDLFGGPELRAAVIELVRLAAFLALRKESGQAAKGILKLLAPALADLRGQGIDVDISQHTAGLEKSARDFAKFTGEAMSTAIPGRDEPAPEDAVKLDELVKGVRRI